MICLSLPEQERRHYDNLKITGETDTVTDLDFADRGWVMFKINRPYIFCCERHFWICSCFIDDRYSYLLSGLDTSGLSVVS